MRVRIGVAKGRKLHARVGFDQEAPGVVGVNGAGTLRADDELECARELALALRGALWPREGDETIRVAESRLDALGIERQRLFEVADGELELARPQALVPCDDA